MKIAASRAQVGYEVGLRPPAFDMASNGVNNVKTLHAIFSTKFNISAADIQIITQPKLSDFLMRLSLHGGLWTFDIRFESYSVACNGLMSNADLVLAMEFISLAETAARSIVVPFNPQMTRAAVSTWYWCAGGMDAAKQHLAQLVDSKLDIKPGFEGAEDVHLQPNINGALINSKEKWSVRFVWEPSVTEHGHLFFQIESRFLEGGRFGTLEDKRAHLDKVHDALLARAGLEVGTVDAIGAQ